MIAPAEESRGREKPVLYLDLDDTVVCWSTGEPEGAEGATEFMLWALENFEVRWLTTWAPSGEMPPNLLSDLASLVSLPVEKLSGIRGLSWEGGSKVDGIAWLEHAVQGRRFVWLEDDTLAEDALEFLEEFGYQHSFHHCNVTRAPGSLKRRHQELRQLLTGSSSASRKPEEHGGSIRPGESSDPGETARGAA